ncbi:methyltransferase type 11 [Ceratobasidium sp. AG-I]|nr:methyltransferase type 11 [Ceratobasidium sp. AG-I]
MQTASEIKALVHDSYSQTARSLSTADREYFNRVSSAFGYTEDDLQILEGANMGLGCGNPVATANIRAGEVVVDLGCGGGMDVILASGKVGSEGKVYGVDMSEDMLAVAKKNIQSRNLTNVELIHSSIDSLPIPSDSVDCIISNCVLNLVPADEKLATIRETYRILKAGGRFAISDIVEKKPMPEEIKRDVVSYVGCVAGALDATTYRQYLADAGFKDIMILDTGSDLSVYQLTGEKTEESNCSSCCGSKENNAARGGLEKSLRNYDINEYVGYELSRERPRGEITRPTTSDLRAKIRAAPSRHR